MASENPSPYQPSSQCETCEQGSGQVPTPSRGSRPASRAVPMFLPALVGALLLALVFVLLNVWWDGWDAWY
ncbi:MAG: hypothetical protein CMM01_18195 [Rhodopirellula sp.]|nr:hypothetical protein [Rhodopirellula sp.]